MQKNIDVSIDYVMVGREASSGLDLTILLYTFKLSFMSKIATY